VESAALAYNAQVLLQASQIKAFAAANAIIESLVGSNER
jgi:hypothetical protein